MGLELTTDMYPPITSQTRYPLRHDMFNSPKPNTSSSIGTTSMCDDPNQTCIKYQSKHNTSSKSPTNILNGSKSSMYHGVTLDTNMTMVTFALVI